MQLESSQTPSGSLTSRDLRDPEGIVAGNNLPIQWRISDIISIESFDVAPPQVGIVAASSYAAVSAAVLRDGSQSPLPR